MNIYSYRILGNFRGTKFRGWEYIFEDSHLVIIDKIKTKFFHVVKILKLQANVQKQQNQFTSNNDMVCEWV